MADHPDLCLGHRGYGAGGHPQLRRPLCLPLLHRHVGGKLPLGVAVYPDLFLHEAGDGYTSDPVLCGKLSTFPLALAD